MKAPMQKIRLTTLLAIAAATLAACGSYPMSTGLLDQSRRDFVAAQSNPKVARYATVEMQQAGDALARANSAADSNESIAEVDKLAYLAKQKIALTVELADQRSAEAQVERSGQARDQMRLDQRTHEANQARADTQRAKSAASAAEMQTRAAQMAAMQASQRAAHLEDQLAALAAQKTQRGIVITLGDVLFGTDVARLNASGLQTARKLADILMENPQRNVQIEGFTDSTGSLAHNQELSERRAAAVTVALIDLGIASTRIRSQGFGELHPVASNQTADERQLNRRVEIVMSDESGQVPPR